jgi:hypothetical protein
MSVRAVRPIGVVGARYCLRTGQDKTLWSGSPAARHVMRLGCARRSVVRRLFGGCGAAAVLLWGALGLRDCEAAAQGAAWHGPRLCRTGLDVCITRRCGYSGHSNYKSLAAWWVRVRCYNYVMSRLSMVGSINLLAANLHSDSSDRSYTPLQPVCSMACNTALR